MPIGRWSNRIAPSVVHGSASWLGWEDSMRRDVLVCSRLRKSRPRNRLPKKQQTLFDEDVEETEPRWVEVNASAVRVENSLQFGGPWLALELIRRLQLDHLLRECDAAGS